MTFSHELTVTDLVMLVNLIVDAAVLFWVLPLRKLRHQLDEFKSARVNDRLDTHEKKIEKHSELIGSLQLFRAGSYGEAIKIFMTRDDFNTEREEASRSRERVNEKLEQGLKNDAAQDARLNLIQNQLDSLFELWNREHHKP